MDKKEASGERAKQYDARENGIWITLAINKEVESVFICTKIDIGNDKAVITYLVYVEGKSPLDESYQVRVIFKSLIHAMRMSTESSSFMDNKLHYFYDGENKRGWMGEVKDSRYLKWFRKASLTNETGFYDHVQHYAMVSWEDMIEVITDTPPEFCVLKPKKSSKFSVIFVGWICIILIYHTILYIISYMNSLL